jgi:hypothetical protein
LPIIVTAPYLLNLWLVDVPDYSVCFVRLILIFTLSECLANSLVKSIQATGNIRNYQLIVGGCQMMNFPISYLCLRLGAPPETIFIVAIIISVVCEICRFFILRKKIGLPIRAFLKNVYCRAIFVAALAAIIPYYIRINVPENFTSFVIIVVVSLICAAMAAYFVGCDRSEKTVIKNQFVKMKQRFFR